MMNCEQVFSRLTRGPFPSGHRDDPHVEAHLARCESCFEMADALRPSLDLFQEAIPAAQRHSLPGYYGAVGSQASNVMVAQVRRLRTDRAARRPAMKSSPTANQYWRYVAFALAGFSLALVLRAVEIAEGETAARNTQAGAAQTK